MHLATSEASWIKFRFLAISTRTILFRNFFCVEPSRCGSWDYQLVVNTDVVFLNLHLLLWGHSYDVCMVLIGAFVELGDLKFVPSPKTVLDNFD